MAVILGGTCAALAFAYRNRDKIAEVGMGLWNRVTGGTPVQPLPADQQQVNQQVFDTTVNDVHRDIGELRKENSEIREKLRRTNIVLATGLSVVSAGITAVFVYSAYKG